MTSDRPVPPSSTAVVLVEYYSDGLVADRARCSIDAGHHVVVADNSGRYSGPGAVVRTGGNVGFGAGCNAAIAALPDGVDVVVLMNPDVDIDRVALERMVLEIREGDWDVLAPVTLRNGERHLGFRRPSPLRECAVTLREAIRMRKGHRGPDRRQRQHLPGVDRHIVPAPPERFGSAALLVIRRSCFDRIGGFDPTYFLYVEDADLWDRLAAEGCSIGFAEWAELVHPSGSGSRATAARRAALRRLGVELYLAARGRPTTPVRWLHRVLLPRSPGDPVLHAIAAGYRAGGSASGIQCRVRRVAVGE